MSDQSARRSYIREFLKSKSGVLGLVLLVTLLATSLYVVTTMSSADIARWQNPAAWEGYPAAAPPVWVNYLGVDAPQTVDLTLSSWSGSASGGTSAYSSAATFAWKHAVSPSDLEVVPQFTGTVYEVEVLWTKPDGNSMQFTVSAPTSGTGYDLTTQSFKQGIVQYIQSQTGTYLSSVTVPQEVAALFNKDGVDLLNNTVLQGDYTVTLDVVGNQAVSVSKTSVSLVGDSYGAMGTDNVGRPIDIGVLAGLPWALEIGALTSLISVVGGVLWGGLSGYLGGSTEKVMSWGTLVILAIPALPFVVAISYTTGLSLLTETLLIAAFSWPFFAIIARTVTLSIKAQTFVEADRAMGVSALRSFATHFLPRLTPLTVAYTALSVSGFIIFGETLAFLGIEPSKVITWGGILNNAIDFDASVHGWWWWVVFPGIMIFVASLPFVLVGFALDRVVAPRVSTK